MDLASILSSLMLLAKVMLFVIVDIIMIVFTAIIIAASTKGIMSTFRRKRGRKCGEE